MFIYCIVVLVNKLSFSLFERGYIKEQMSQELQLSVEELLAVASRCT